MSPQRRSKISVILDEPEFRRFDQYCSTKGYKKSTLIARLVREHLDHEGYAIQRSLPLDARRDTEPHGEAPL